MRAVLPGKPQAALQAVCTTEWRGRRLVVYISGNALVILGGPHQLLQTIYHDESQDLGAVAIDEESGKIATCSKGTIYIYQPFGQSEDVLKWSQQHILDIDSKVEITCTLSWGSTQELLVGSTDLRLYQTDPEMILLWKRELSSPASLAEFSPDAGLIATVARYDRLVKLWRRLSYGSDDVRFDFSYLSHPSTVTRLHWRTSSNSEARTENILYTVCTDNKVRIWSAMELHGSQVLQLWTEIDVLQSIQPRYLNPSQNHERYVLFIDGHDFSKAVAAAQEDTTQNAHRQQRDALEYLADISKRNPEVCVVFDSQGHMSAWGVETVGSRDRTANQVFNFAHVEDCNIIQGQTAAGPLAECIRFISFCTVGPEVKFATLVHYFDGRIVWMEGRIDELFDPSPGRARLHAKALWTGHQGSVKKVMRTIDGQALMSRTNDNEGIIWKQRHGKDGMALSRQSLLNSYEHIHRTWLIDDGQTTANLHHESLSVWNTASFEAEEIGRCKYQLEGKPLCLLQLPTPDSQTISRFLATISSRMKGIVWELRFPENSLTGVKRDNASRPILSELCTFDLGLEIDLAFVVPVDPAGSAPIVSGFLDTFAKDVAISYTKNGVFHTWAAKVDPMTRSVDWLLTSTVETGIDHPFLASGSSIRKIALVNSSRNGLSIWDSRSNQLEYDMEYNVQDMICDLDWTSTPDEQSILAVGFPHKVVILAQVRYDYIDKGAAWAPIREIYIRESTPHPIGDSVWLGSGNLVIGAGTQLFVYDKLVTTSDSMITELSVPAYGRTLVDLFEVVSAINGPLPLYHPQFLSQCILAGKLALVSKILVILNKSLKFSTEDHVNSLLGLSIQDLVEDDQNALLAGRKEMNTGYAENADEDEQESVTEEMAITLNENLARSPLAHLSTREQSYLADLIECFATAEKNRRSIDENAMRYLLFVRQHLLRTDQDPESIQGITWREYSWAFHSGSQDILVDLVSRHYSGKMLWEHARESGIFVWMTDINALRAQFETIARNEYTKTDEKNPIDCSLYYLALKKKNVLLGLWRMAAWNKEQSSTQKFLANNFQDQKWKTAALKNAYALLGKRRFEYAAAFFLLAGNLRDAVNICTQQIRDIQLAIAIARVYEGDHGPVLRELLEDKILPLAAIEGNRWMAMWAFWMLGRRDMAVRALISPVYTLLETPETPSQEARSYLATDPASVVLYKQLRDKTLQTLRGASKISPRAEWEFVMQTARLYDRMGCDILALDLVRNWEFLNHQDTANPLTDIPDPRKMLRRRSSLVVDDLPTPKSPTGKKVGSGMVANPTQFSEPDANSLLDSFGF